jgi:hypothetical protein
MLIFLAVVVVVVVVVVRRVNTAVNHSINLSCAGGCVGGCSDKHDIPRMVPAALVTADRLVPVNWMVQHLCNVHDEKCGCGTVDKNVLFVRRAFTPAIGGLNCAQTPKSAGFVKTVTARISNASQCVTCSPKPTFYAAILLPWLSAFQNSSQRIVWCRNGNATSKLLHGTYRPASIARFAIFWRAQLTVQ